MPIQASRLSLVALAASMFVVALVAALLWRAAPGGPASASGVPPIEAGPSGDAEPEGGSLDKLDPAPYLREDPPPVPEAAAFPTARVSVQNEELGPVAGARLFGSNHAAGTGDWTRMAVTGGDGLATLNLRAPSVLVRVVAEGYQPLETAIESASDGLIVLTLAQAARIEGRVVEAGSEVPLEGATVVAWPLGRSPPKDLEGAVYRGTLPGGFRSVSGPGGEFALDGLAPGVTYSIAVSATGFVGVELSEAEAPSDSVMLEVTPLYVLVARLVHRDGTPVWIDRRLVMCGVDRPPEGSSFISDDGPLQAWHALPDAIRRGGKSGRLMVLCFAKPVHEQRIGPCTLIARLAGIGDVADRNIWAYRASADVPVQDVVVDRVPAAVGTLRFVIDHDSVKSFRKVEDAAHLGELIIVSESAGVHQVIIGIGQLDGSGALTIGPVPEGLYRASFKTSHNHFHYPDASGGYAWRVHVAGGKTTELVCKAGSTGSISWRLAGSDPGGQALLTIVSLSSRINSTGFWSTYGSADVIPLLPPGPYRLKLMWRAERSPAHEWTEIGTAEVVVESGKVTEVVFEK